MVEGRERNLILADVESITRGDWTHRLASFRTIFGEAPQFVREKVEDLEQIRNIRNNFAHGFGRELAVPAPSDQAMRSIDRISVERFLRYVGVISKVAARIDKFLLDGFIGNFELIHFYHEWKENPRPAEDRGYTAPRAFKRALGRDAKCNVSLGFCKGLIAYYDAL